MYAVGLLGASMPRLRPIVSRAVVTVNIIDRESIERRVALGRHDGVRPDAVYTDHRVMLTVTVVRRISSVHSRGLHRPLKREELIGPGRNCTGPGLALSARAHL